MFCIRISSDSIESHLTPFRLRTMKGFLLFVFYDERSRQATVSWTLGFIPVSTERSFSIRSFVISKKVSIRSNAFGTTSRRHVSQSIQPNPIDMRADAPELGRKAAGYAYRNHPRKAWKTSMQIGFPGGSRNGRVRTTKVVVVGRHMENRRLHRRSGDSDDQHEGSKGVLYTILNRGTVWMAVLSASLSLVPPAGAGPSNRSLVEKRYVRYQKKRDCDVRLTPRLSIFVVEDFIKELPEKALIAISLMATAYVGYLVSSKLSDKEDDSVGKKKPLDPKEFQQVHFRQGWEPSEEQLKKSAYLRAEHELRMREIAARNREREERIKREESRKTE